MTTSFGKLGLDSNEILQHRRSQPTGYPLHSQPPFPVNLGEILSLIDARKYFILHAPRQTGKTSCMLAPMKHLNEKGDYQALYINIEAAQVAREEVHRGIHTLISVLRQIRSGYADRPESFPQSIVLCGVRDVRDYRIHSSRTKETGQIFEVGILDLAWDYTGGQPWLVNALAYETCFRTKESKDRTKPPLPTNSISISFSQPFRNFSRKTRISG